MSIINIIYNGSSEEVVVEQNKVEGLSSIIEFFNGVLNFDHLETKFSSLSIKVFIDHLKSPLDKNTCADLTDKCLTDKCLTDKCRRIKLFDGVPPGVILEVANISTMLGVDSLFDLCTSHLAYLAVKSSTQEGLRLLLGVAKPNIWTKKMTSNEIINTIRKYKKEEDVYKFLSFVDGVTNVEDVASKIWSSKDLTKKGVIKVLSIDNSNFSNEDHTFEVKIPFTRENEAFIISNNIKYFEDREGNRLDPESYLGY